MTEWLKWTELNWTLVIGLQQERWEKIVRELVQYFKTEASESSSRMEVTKYWQKNEYFCKPKGIREVWKLWIFKISSTQMPPSHISGSHSPPLRAPMLAWQNCQGWENSHIWSSVTLRIEFYHCRQESLRRNGVAILVNKMQYLDAISKTTEWSLFISKANHSISQ